MTHREYHPKITRAEVQRLPHAVIERRTGDRYESKAWKAECSCGWNRIGFQAEVRKAGAKHLKEST